MEPEKYYFYHYSVVFSTKESSTSYGDGTLTLPRKISTYAEYLEVRDSLIKNHNPSGNLIITSLTFLGEFEKMEETP